MTNSVPPSNDAARQAEISDQALMTAVTGKMTELRGGGLEQGEAVKRIHAVIVQFTGKPQGQLVEIAAERRAAFLEAIGAELPVPGPDPAPKPSETPKEAPTASFRSSLLIRADQVEDNATEWLWEEWIPFGELTILAGDGGAGKSTLSAWLAAAVTT